MVSSNSMGRQSQQNIPSLTSFLTVTVRIVDGASLLVLATVEWFSLDMTSFQIGQHIKRGDDDENTTGIVSVDGCYCLRWMQGI